MGTPGWQHVDHDADMGIVGTGRSVAEAFEQVAMGMTAIVTDAPIGRSVHVHVSCQAPDLELLLVDWLNALIYEMATRSVLLGAFSVVIQNHHLYGEAWGEPVDTARHQPAVEVKGATLTGVRVRQEANGVWHAQCVVDV
jgi:SHS2 domain-containing protein